MTLREMSDTLKATDATPFIPESMFMHRDVRTWGGVFSGTPYPERHPDTDQIVIHPKDGKSWWYLTIRGRSPSSYYPLRVLQVRAADKREALEGFCAMVAQPASEVAA